MSGLQDIRLQELISKYSIENFIETGSHEGTGINYVLHNGIANIYSCDINKYYVDICKAKFPNATILHCSSVDFLNEVQDLIPGPSLIWLDAHLGYYLYGSDNKDVNMNLPLWDEVVILAKKDGIEKDIILIDDIRIINSEDNITFDKSLKEEYQMKNITIKMITDLFPKHNYELLNWQEGVLFLLPKI